MIRSLRARVSSTKAGLQSLPMARCQNTAAGQVTADQKLSIAIDIEELKEVADGMWRDRMQAAEADWQPPSGLRQDSAPAHRPVEPAYSWTRRKPDWPAPFHEKDTPN